ncbi:MAG: hypothetical protein HY703_14140 [Gemmatimonadetes bacterium]|nr:hypothetical protein [Gemmatimonadota bacterium]
MDVLLQLLRVLHVVTAILMAWPFYALVTVNQRARLGPPLGDRTDVYMENIVRNRTVPCFVFQATALVTGLALVVLRGLSLSTLLTNPLLAAKFTLLLLIAGLLTYVHVGLQPRIDALFAAAATPVSQESAGRIAVLRLRRKRIASACMFVVLILAMLGVQVWAPLPAWLTLALVVAIAVFTWRSYKSVTPYGWA